MKEITVPQRKKRFVTITCMLLSMLLFLFLEGSASDVGCFDANTNGDEAGNCGKNGEEYIECSEELSILTK